MKAILCIFVIVLAILFVNAAYAQEGLSLYFSFNDASGKVVEDLSGNENDGTMEGAAKIVDAKMGTALELDGINSAVMVPDADTLEVGEGSLTIECWIKFSDTPTNSRIVSKGNSNWTNGYIFQISVDSRFAISISDGSSGALYAVCKKTVNDGGWHHIAGIVDRDKNECRMFADGNQEAFDFLKNPRWGAQSAPKDIGPIDNNNVLHIGKWEANREWLEAIVDEVRVWNRALTDGEIRRAMDGNIGMSVEPAGKLPIAWAHLKSRVR